MVTRVVWTKYIPYYSFAVIGYLLAHIDSFQDTTTGDEVGMAFSKMYGSIDSFWQKDQAIEAYLKWIILYFMTNDIAKTKHVPILLTIIGKRHYALLKDFFAPVTPAGKSYARLPKH